MRTLYFDCFSGASGDMLLGALVDLGVDPDALALALAPLGVEFRLETSRVSRSALGAVKVDVVVGDKVESYGRVVRRGEGGRDEHATGHDHAHGRSLGEILDIVERAELSPLTKSRARAVFERLGAAEARAHNTTARDVHFHEVGAIDAIVDVVGTCVGVEMLGVERFVVSPIAVGSGRVTFSHGTYPVPTPATIELLRGFEVYAGPVEGELATPTGAALLATLADASGRLPAMRVDRVGYGAGSRDVANHPNVLRLVMGDAVGAEARARAGGDRDETIVVLEASIDDMTGEALGHFAERALAEGALDVYFAPIQMKKNRPGVLLTLLAEPGDFDRLSRLTFRETTTIGLRHRPVARRALEREHVRVETDLGTVRVRVARLDGDVVNAAPEYEDCRDLADRANVALGEVQRQAIAAWRRAVATEDRR